MMSDLLQRGEALASQGQQQRLQAVAQQLRALFGSAAVQVDGAQVLVSGRGLIKRWLIDPSLRFLDGGLK
jgi:hypothetical protein